jgi:hypothetical protein
VSNGIVSIGGTKEPASWHESPSSRGLKYERFSLGVAVALVALLAPAERAHANGALPGSSGILLPADHPQQIMLATNFGLIISQDGGASWLWSCERPQVSYGYLYSISSPPRDRIYALANTLGPSSIDDGWLSYSDDASCTWTRVGGALQDVVVRDYFVDRGNPEHVLAVGWARQASGDPGPPLLFESTDAAATFSGTPLYNGPAGATVVSIEIARSNPMVVYTAMYTAPDRHPRLLRSNDGGRTWPVDRDIEAGIGAHEFRILTDDPADPDVLYLRVIGLGTESVVVTRDAGMTFTTAVTVSPGVLSAFLRLASGTVLVGGLVNMDGGGGGMTGVAYRSTDGGNTFVPWTLAPQQPHILGLAERDGVLYIAGKNYSDGWALATSRDEGVTIQPLSRYEDVRGIMPCAMNMCGEACQFVASQAVWTNDVCTGARLDAGTTIDGGPPDGGPPPPPKSGCHCAAAGVPGANLVAWIFAGAALAVRRRRRRS